jgi:hypothetical protein
VHRDGRVVFTALHDQLLGAVFLIVVVMVDHRARRGSVDGSGACRRPGSVLLRSA